MCIRDSSYTAPWRVNLAVARHRLESRRWLSSRPSSTSKAAWVPGLPKTCVSRGHALISRSE
eukprot:3987901-Prymnesium_polylepis.2